MKLSDEERKQSQLTDENLNLALRSLRESGCLIIESVLPSSLVEDLLAAYVAIDRPKHVPKQLPFYHPEVIANPIALQLLTAALGRKIFFSLYFFHAVSPQTGPPAKSEEEKARGVHRDGNHLFPELPYVLPASGIYIDIPLVDFTVENGATRLWPGTHLITDRSPDEIRYLQDRAARLPSYQAIMPAGSLMIRDQRTWHAPSPNSTDQVRIMLDLGYFRVFQHYQERISMAKDLWENVPKRERKTLRIDVTE